MRKRKIGERINAGDRPLDLPRDYFTMTEVERREYFKNIKKNKIRSVS